MQNKLIEEIYDYISFVTIRQGKLLPEKVLYGDGSRWNYDKNLFHLVYSKIQELLK